jgi:hypothetical protein
MNPDAKSIIFKPFNQFFYSKAANLREERGKRAAAVSRDKRELLPAGHVKSDVQAGHSFSISGNSPAVR